MDAMEIANGLVSLLDVARGERPVGFDHVSVGVNASSFHIGYMSIEILRLNYDI